MGRPVVLSNGQMFVGLDENGLVHDFYYPYVGLENLTNARSSQHKIGIWIDNKFSWTNDGTWEIRLDFDNNALISNIHFHSNELALSLHLQDYIDNDNNAFIRGIKITNEAPKDREVRLFMHQVFELSHNGRADTALYVPDDNYILDYKGRYCLLIGGKFKDGSSFDQYAVGNYGIENKAGTYIDAEDGVLSNNPVEHGGVDSVIRFTKEISSHGTTELNYWVIAGSSQTDIQNVHQSYLSLNMKDKQRHVQQYWEEWLDSPKGSLPEFHLKSLKHSLLIIKAHCDSRGSVLASGDSSIFNYGRDYYCYCWPRDAAYALWPLIRLGHFDEAKSFFEFARDTRHPNGYLMHKYQPDRAIGSTWHPLVHGRRKELAIQEDETASVIYMINEYLQISEDIDFIKNLYPTLIAPAANFMSTFIDKETGLPHASYDLWEEKFLTSTYTVSTVIAALKAASKMATVFEAADDHLKWSKAAELIQSNFGLLYKNGQFVKGLLLQEDKTITYDETTDISNLYGPYMYAGLAIDDHHITSTVEKIEKKLLNVTPSGGVIRYENDNYFLTKHQYSGNPWIVTTLWLAQYYIGIQKTDKANALLDWALARELPSGVLSEQFDPESGNSLGVTPLVWSHAELVNTLLDLAK